MAVFGRFNIVRTGLDGRFHHLVCIADFRLVGNLADTVEGEGDRSGFTQRTTSLGKDGSYIGGSAVTVVGKRLDDDGDAARAVAFVADLIIVLAFGTRSLLDGALDIVFRHRLGLGVLDGQTQARVHVRVGHARLGRNGDFARKLGKHFGPHGVLLALAVHDVLEL